MVHAATDLAGTVEERERALRRNIKTWGYPSGVDMMQRTNWKPKEGSPTTRTPEHEAKWQRQMNCDANADTPRDLAFYTEFDERMRNRVVQHRPMPYDERQR